MMGEDKAVPRRSEALVAQDRDLLEALVQEALEQILRTKMTDFLGASSRTISSKSPGAAAYSRSSTTISLTL